MPGREAERGDDAADDAERDGARAQRVVERNRAHREDGAEDQQEALRLESPEDVVPLHRRGEEHGERHDDQRRHAQARQRVTQHADGQAMTAAEYVISTTTFHSPTRP
jgi:hypothetical protein